MMAGLFINVNYIVVPTFLMLNGGDRFLRQFNLKILLDNPIVLSVVYAATAIPFTVYLLSSYFRSLPKAYGRSGVVDGCGYFKTMFKIVIPMAKPSIITVILFNFLAFWNEKDISLP